MEGVALRLGAGCTLGKELSRKDTEGQKEEEGVKERSRSRLFKDKSRSVIRKCACAVCVCLRSIQ